MKLIPSNRYTPEDLPGWEVVCRTAEVHRKTVAHRRRVERASRALVDFASEARCYTGVSWGKDSVVIADLVARLCPHVPLVWVRVEPIANPDCGLVRDAFLKRYPRLTYHEEVVNCSWWGDDWHASGTLEEGFQRATRRFGTRYISGIRGEESGQRKRRMMTYGESSLTTCAPIGFWSALDVWAYTLTHDLPVHPAYACTMGGTLDPSRIRVASLGGKRGLGRGRAEWESLYYGEELARLSSGQP